MTKQLDHPADMYQMQVEAHEITGFLYVFKAVSNESMELRYLFGLILDTLQYDLSYPGPEFVDTLHLGIHDGDTASDLKRETMKRLG